MKYSKYFRILAVALTAALLVVLLPATPVLGAVDLRLYPDTGEIGDEVEIYGSDFDPGEVLRFYFSDEKAYAGDRINVDIDNYEHIGGTTADSAGNFQDVYFNVPNRLRDGDDVVDVTGGTYYVYAADYYGDIIDREQFVIESVAEVSIDPDDGIVGTEVEITGLGFDSNEDIIVEYDNDEVDIVSGDTDTDSDGEFTCTIVIPESIAGDHTVTVTGDDSNNSGADTFTVEPEIILSKTSGVAGETITVSGTGFGDELDYQIWFNNTEVAADDTDNDGSFSIFVTIPSLGPGTYSIEVEDDDNNDASAQFSLAVAAVSINPTTGFVNTAVTVSGTGFQASKPVTVTFDNENVTTKSTDPSGSVSVTFNIPARGAGTYTVRVSDGTNIAEASFSISTSVSISPETSAAAPGHINTEVTISGIGYTAGTQVNVTYDGTPVATSAVNADGSFSSKFNVPASTGGQHAIIANIGTTTKQFSFFMETTPPQWPVPLLPEMGIETEAQVHFDWEDVTDPSGVTYTLQIATSADFSQDSLVITKPGLLKSEYTLTEEEKLEAVSEENPYYWRVRAIDGVANEGEWSGAGEFYVKGISWGIPKPVVYTLIAIGAIVVIVLGFWLGRKTAYY